jgi:hypothetical protein
MSNSHKATIETIINTAAIALTAFGTNAIIQGSYYGFLCIVFAVAMEWFKYWGRDMEWW